MLIGLLAVACRANRPMVDRVEMPDADSTLMADPMKADGLFDTMPGGEMVRGNPSATARLLKAKIRR